MYIHFTADGVLGFINPLTESEHEATKINGDSQCDENKETTVSLGDRESITDHTEL